jgi:hypothetical protein
MRDPTYGPDDFFLSEEQRIDVADSLELRARAFDELARRFEVSNDFDSAQRMTERAERLRGLRDRFLSDDVALPSIAIESDRSSSLGS